MSRHYTYVLRTYSTYLMITKATGYLRLWPADEALWDCVSGSRAWRCFLGRFFHVVHPSPGHVLTRVVYVRTKVRMYEYSRTLVPCALVSLT